MAVTSIVAYIWSKGGIETPPFKLSGQVKSGLPDFAIPAFSVDNGNGTVTTFMDMLQDFGLGAVFVPLVAILANISIAKAFCE